MKALNYKQILALVASLCVLTFTLAACSVQDDQTDAAEQNRQYMALLNSEMADMQTVMDDFETAVADGNVVAMRTQLGNAQDVLETIEKQEPTDSLADARDQYIDALTSLNAAMTAYVDLFAEAQNQQMSESDVASAMADIQSNYDDGVDKLEKADESIAELAQG